MNAAAINALMARIQALEEAMPSIRKGEVTATSPLAVAPGGSTVSYTDCHRLASYAPTIGDQVEFIIIRGNDLLVLGEVV